MELLSSEAVLLCSLFVWLSMAAGSGEFGAAGMGLDERRTWLRGQLASSGTLLGARADSSIPSARFPLILAATRTKRPDLLNRFKFYRGGWDITNRHYWTSIGFTGAAGFILSFMWFTFFGVVLLASRCSKWGINMKHKKLSSYGRQIYLMLLVIFTCAALIGCILLSVGQDEFHKEVLDTLNFVVNQSDFTVQILRNVTEFLLLAKTVNVDQVILPQDVPGKLDKLIVDLNRAASMLSEKTTENSGKIRRVFGDVRCTLIAVAAVMLVLASVGFREFVFSGWLLVTLVLCGVFIILNNAISDTCVAMNEWVENPHAETALSSILPCVDERTSNSTLHQSKQVVVQLVNVINTVIHTIVNADPSQLNSSSYYNQSGPLMPALCSPFDFQLDDQRCQPPEVSLDNASLVWQSYACEVTPSGSCATVGRITPDLYRQLVVATFTAIGSLHCPRLKRNLPVVEAGLAMTSAGAMLCLVLWLLHPDSPRREEASVKPGPAVPL
ncbi:unnamed protein product [Spirodela intermedia]|uniref:Uncharacterized protein n=1 Tax=Spirodela intermedia TaxID=51605 RepID=A0A7I8J5B8_SPIIN|nr:unnamed protein product [Spirodela intermedia]CAA6665427.1 unnamed protein product [Spirodela intermedia]